MKKITCVGGSKDQRTYKYPDPLPKSIEFVDVSQGRREVYYRKPSSTEYIHADEVKDWQVRKSLGLED